MAEFCIVVVGFAVMVKKVKAGYFREIKLFEEYRVSNIAPKRNQLILGLSIFGSVQFWTKINNQTNFF